jgi:hypothetical protein
LSQQHIHGASIAYLPKSFVRVWEQNDGPRNRPRTLYSSGSSAYRPNIFPAGRVKPGRDLRNPPEIRLAGMRVDSRASIGCVSRSSRGRCARDPIRQFGAWRQVALATIRAGFAAFGLAVL